MPMILATSKKEIYRNISLETGCTHATAKVMVDTFTDILKKDLLNGRAYIDGIGGFYLKKRAARVGHDPRNGSEIQIPASYSVRFKPSSDIKTFVNAQVKGKKK